MGVGGSSANILSLMTLWGPNAFEPITPPKHLLLIAWLILVKIERNSVLAFEYPCQASRGLFLSLRHSLFTLPVH